MPWQVENRSGASSALKKIAVALVAVYAVLLSATATIPFNYQVERSLTIDAPPELVLAYVKSQRPWMPWTGNRVERALHGVDSTLMKHCTSVSVVGDRERATLTWRRHGTHSFVGKALTLFLGQSWLIAEEFENGLAELKRLAEAEARRQAERVSPP